MFISQREYEQLVRDADRAHENDQLVETLKEEIYEKNRIAAIKAEDQKRADAIKDEDHKRAIRVMEIRVEEANRVSQVDKDAAVREAVEAAVSELKVENTSLKIEKERYADRAAMLEKAFENMGFDVKDMKEILGKLVDGLIAKHEINVIKTS